MKYLIIDTFNNKKIEVDEKNIKYLQKDDYISIDDCQLKVMYKRYDIGKNVFIVYVEKK